MDTLTFFEAVDNIFPSYRKHVNHVTDYFSGDKLGYPYYPNKSWHKNKRHPKRLTDES